MQTTFKKWFFKLFHKSFCCHSITVFWLFVNLYTINNMRTRLVITRLDEVLSKTLVFVGWSQFWNSWLHTFRRIRYIAYILIFINYFRFFQFFFLVRNSSISFFNDLILLNSIGSNMHTFTRFEIITAWFMPGASSFGLVVRISAIGV